MTIDDAALLEACGAYSTRDRLKNGTYANGYYPGYIRDAVEEVGCEQLFAAVLTAHDAPWAHRVLCLCDPDPEYTGMLIAVIREYGRAGEFWAVLFTHGRSMPRHEFERIGRLLIESADAHMIYCATTHVPGFRTFRSRQAID